MKNVKAILVCMAGMSTNVMRGKIEEAAKGTDISLDIKAVGMDSIRDNLEGLDVVLLGPQIRYAEKSISDDLAKSSPSTKLIVIDSKDFGMMRGDEVFRKMCALLGVES